MSLETCMREALDRATEMVREEGGVPPTFLIASAEGTYTLALAAHGTLELDDIAMQVVSAVMRWSMARAFIMTCEHKTPWRLAAYVVTAGGVEGVSLAISGDPPSLGPPKLVTPPSRFYELCALIPPRVSEMSWQEIALLEEVLGMEIEDQQSYFIS